MQKNLCLNITLLIAVVTAVSFCLFINYYFSTSNKQAERDFSKEYTMKKIDEISDKIINRQPVEKSYFYFLRNDEDLITGIEEYNIETGVLTEYFTKDAILIVTYMCGLNNEDDTVLYNSALDYTKLPLETHELIERIAEYSLQENASQLILADAMLAQIITGDLGGSNGMWPSHIRGRLSLEGNEVSEKDFTDYQQSAGKLIAELEKYRFRVR